MSTLLQLLGSFLRLALLASVIFIFTRETAQKEERIIFSSPDVITRHLAYLTSKEIKFPLVAMAQEVHETDWFRSKVYRENYNRFGMKTNSRPFHKGELNNHARYENFDKSILDYAAWQKMRLRQNPWVTNDSLYLEMLERVGYAEDVNYKKKLKRVIAELQLLRALPEGAE